MTTNNRPFLRQSKAIFLLLFVALFILMFSAFRGGTAHVFEICIFYAVMTTVFLAAQILAFVASHAHYSDSIEEPKFRVLENEENEWKSYVG